MLGLARYLADFDRFAATKGPQERRDAEAVPFDGELTCDHLDALSPGAYRCGQIWGIHIEVAGITVYHEFELAAPPLLQRAGR